VLERVQYTTGPMANGHGISQASAYDYIRRPICLTQSRPGRWIFEWPTLALERGAVRFRRPGRLGEIPWSSAISRRVALRRISSGRRCDCSHLRSDRAPFITVCQLGCQPCSFQVEGQAPVCMMGDLLSKLGVIVNPLRFSRSLFSGATTRRTLEGDT